MPAWTTPAAHAHCTGNNKGGRKKERSRSWCSRRRLVRGPLARPGGLDDHRPWRAVPCYWRATAGAGVQRAARARAALARAFRRRAEQTPKRLKSSRNILGADVHNTCSHQEYSWENQQVGGALPGNPSTLPGWFALIIRVFHRLEVFAGRA
jgi:hypothetical protein